MWNANFTLYLIWLFMATFLVSCSSKPVYEKMSTAYIIHLDMKHDDTKKQALSSLPTPDVRDENMDLVDQLVNKEIREQMNQEE